MRVKDLKEGTRYEECLTRLLFIRQLHECSTLTRSSSFASTYSACYSIQVSGYFKRKFFSPRYAKPKRASLIKARIAEVCPFILSKHDTSRKE